MKTKISLLITLATGIILSAKPYALIDKEFTKDGCDYFVVSVWDDGGTPFDRSDDIKMGTSTFNDCVDGVVHDEPVGELTASVVDHFQMEGDCYGYVVKISDSQGNEILTDAMDSDNCLDILGN